MFLKVYNALLTGKLGAQRVIFPRAVTCYTFIQSCALTALFRAVRFLLKS